jgi:hypothetical protein
MCRCVDADYRSRQLKRQKLILRRGYLKTNDIPSKPVLRYAQEPDVSTHHPVLRDMLKPGLVLR